MKNTVFFWGWQDYPPTEDKAMTRDRQARLMRAWRNSKTQGRRNFKFEIIERGPKHRAYRVSTTKYINQDFGTLIICT